MTSETRNGQTIDLRRTIFALALLFTKDRATSKSELAEKIRGFKWKAQKNGLKIKITVVRHNGNFYSCSALNNFIDRFNVLGKLARYDLVQINNQGEEYCLTIISEALKRESFRKTRKSVEESINMWVDLYDHRELIEKIIDEKIIK